MRKSIIFAALVIAAAALTSSCQFMNAPGVGPSAQLEQDLRGAGGTADSDPIEVVESATGSAHLVNSAGFFRRVTFNVRRYEDGTVDGEFQLVAGAAIIHAEPTCFTIDGSIVRIAGIVENPLFVLNVPPGSGFVIQVSDEGEGANDDVDTTSRIFFNVPLEDLDGFCETGDAPGDLIQFALTQGNVQIHN